MPNPELNQPPLLDRITLLRELGGFSLKEAASRSKVSTAYLHQLEKGKIKSPSPHKLKAIANGINVHYIQLMALAGYSLEISPQEADPVRHLEQAIGVEGISFDAARFLFTMLREARLGKEVGIPYEVTGRLTTAAIRARAGSSEATDEIMTFFELARSGQLDLEKKYFSKTF